MLQITGTLGERECNVCMNFSDICSFVSVHHVHPARRLWKRQETLQNEWVPLSIFSPSTTFPIRTVTNHSTFSVAKPTFVHPFECLCHTSTSRTNPRGPGKCSFSNLQMRLIKKDIIRGQKAELPRVFPLGCLIPGADVGWRGFRTSK